MKRILLTLAAVIGFSLPSMAQIPFFHSTMLGTNACMGTIPPGGKADTVFAAIDSNGLITIYQGTASKILTNTLPVGSNQVYVATSGDGTFSAGDAVALYDVSANQYYFGQVNNTNGVGLIMTNLVVNSSYSSPAAFVAGDVVYRLVALHGRVAGNAQATYGPNVTTNAITSITLPGISATDTYPIAIVASKASGSVTNIGAFATGSLRR